MSDKLGFAMFSFGFALTLQEPNQHCTAPSYCRPALQYLTDPLLPGLIYKQC